MSPDERRAFAGGTRIAPSQFEDRYARDEDPWGFRTRPYERAKHARTAGLVASLRPGSVFEPGAANGALSALLAPVCEELVTLEASSTAANAARTTLAGADGVTVLTGTVPEDWPARVFDCVVLSEIGYYFDADGWTYVLDTCVRLSRPRGVVSVHWRGHSPDHVRHGDDVHAALRGFLGPPAREHVTRGYVAGVWGAG